MPQLSQPRVAQRILPILKDLGDGFVVRRALPSDRRMMVGPFIFVDHFGPARLAPGHGVDSRPHPHIGLATVSYLIEGEMRHRDSLGHDAIVGSGDVAVMTAGRGIVHSERSSDAARAGDSRLTGLQAWIALPGRHEEAAPDFVLTPAAAVPVIEGEGATLRLLLGDYGAQAAPGPTWGETLYADLALAAGRRFALPAKLRERACYLLSGTIAVAGTDRSYGAGELLLFEPGADIVIEARSAARLMLIGGEPFGAPRTLWWNFVASTPERIERAKADWRDRRFPAIAGETEFTPLPADA